MPRRRELFEFNDASWVPAVFRRGITSYLHAAHRAMRTERYFAPKVAAVIQQTGVTNLVDLCSGGAGPVPALLRELNDRHGFQATATLTDLYPNADAVDAINARGDATLRYHPTPVDATAVPPDLPGVRTMVCGFHHFPPEAARRVLRDAQARRQPISIFETTQNSVPGVLAMALLMPLMALLLTPLVRPMTVSQLVFTYLVPILPLMLTWDGRGSTVAVASPRSGAV